MLKQSIVFLSNPNNTLLCVWLSRINLIQLMEVCGCNVTKLRN